MWLGFCLNSILSCFTCKICFPKKEKINSLLLIYETLLQVTDADIAKEAMPSFYLKYILPILYLNKVIHFIGFGNRLASDPVPFDLQVDLHLLLYVNVVPI